MARLACVLALAACSASAAVEPADPFRQSAGAYLIEVNGQPRWQRDADARLAPASLTKIMTALLALESRRPPEEGVIVSREAAAETGTRLGLRAGERLRFGDLLAATVMQSANDACHALAAHLGGNQAQFVAMMNLRAQALGLRATHFTNACGHDEPEHRSSARDLAVLGETVMKVPGYAGIAGGVGRTIRALDSTREFRVENKNELIGRYRGAIGVKSGSTPGAGKCVVALAERDGVRVLLVLLHADERWWTAVDMLNYAFEHAD